jgi:hypothetical protein
MTRAQIRQLLEAAAVDTFPSSGVREFLDERIQQITRRIDELYTLRQQFEHIRDGGLTHDATQDPEGDGRQDE